KPWAALVPALTRRGNRCSYRMAVIPGRCEASNPESRDSGSGPSDHPGMTIPRSQHLLDPVVRIGGAAVLDVDQLLAHPHGDGAGGAAADQEIAVHGTHLAERRDHG